MEIEIDSSIFPRTTNCFENVVTESTECREIFYMIRMYFSVLRHNFKITNEEIKNTNSCFSETLENAPVTIITTISDNKTYNLYILSSSHNICADNENV